MRLADGARALVFRPAELNFLAANWVLLHARMPNTREFLAKIGFVSLFCIRANRKALRNESLLTARWRCER